MTLTNLLYPALFASVWILIFSGTALYFQSHLDTGGADLYAVLNDRGVENVLYELFRQLPFSQVWIPLLLFIAYGDLSSRLMGGDTHGSGMPTSKGIDVQLEVLK